MGLSATGKDFQEINQAVKDWVEDDGDEFAAHSHDFIKLVESRVYKELDLRIFRKHSQTQLTASDPFLLMPTGNDIIIRGLHILTLDGSRKFLQLKNYSYIREYHPVSTETGEPKYYARWSNDVLILAPTPDSAYTVEIEISSRPDSIVPANFDPVSNPTANGTSWLGDNAWDLLLYGALIEAYGFRKGEQQAIGTGGTPGLWHQKYAEAVARLTALEARERVDDFRANEPK